MKVFNSNTKFPIYLSMITLKIAINLLKVAGAESVKKAILQLSQSRPQYKPGLFIRSLLWVYMIQIGADKH